MIYHVEITKQAKEDLYAIYKYIADVLLEQATAIKQFERIESAIFSLCKMPERYRIYDNNLLPNVRFVPVDNYLVFYTVDNEGFAVNITRIFYGGRSVEESY